MPELEVNISGFEKLSKTNQNIIIQKLKEVNNLLRRMPVIGWKPRIIMPFPVPFKKRGRDLTKSK